MVEFHYRGDATSFVKESAKAQKALQQTGQIAEKSSKQATGGYTKLKAALAGVGLIAFAEKSAHAFLDEQVATAKLQNTLKNNPQLTHANEKAFEDLAKSISYKTAADRESVLSGISVLGNFKLNQQQIEQLTPLVVDFARKTGRDVPEAAGLIGKAMLGNARALKTIGINYKATGDTAKDYGTILTDLKGKVSGYADAEEKSRHNIDVMQHRFHDLQVEVGGKLLASFDFLIRNFRVLGPLIGVIAAAIASVKIAKFGKDLGAALGAVQSGFKKALAGSTGLFSGLSGLSTGLGVVGIALAAGVGAWALWNKGQSDAKARANDYLGALKQEQDGLKGVSDALFINNLQQSGALKIAHDLGISGADLVGYLHGQADATNRVTAAATKQAGVVTSSVGGLTTYVGKGAQLVSILGDQRDAYNTATDALGNVDSAQKSAATSTTALGTAAKTAAVRILGMTQTDFKTWSTKAVTDVNFVSGSLSTLGGNAKLTAKDILKAFTDNLTAMAQYRTNFDTLLKRHIPNDLAVQLEGMGQQGAQIVAALAHANDRQFNAIVSRWDQAGHDARGFPKNVQAMAAGVNRALGGIKGRNVVITFKPVIDQKLLAQIRAVDPHLAALMTLKAGFAKGGEVGKGLPKGTPVDIRAHAGEYVLTVEETARRKRGLEPDIHPMFASTLGASRGGDGVGTTITHDDHSVTHIYNPVPERLSETLPALRRRKQLMRGL